jgi:hypothetical protein
MKALLIFFIAISIASDINFSEEKIISQQDKKAILKGKVLSKSDSTPLLKAMISVPSIKYGTITNISGDFVLNLDTVAIKSFVVVKDGYKSKTVTIENKSDFLILLDIDK